MIIYEEKVVTKIERTMSKVVCDVCGKEINKGDIGYEVTTSHNDWGVESDESVICKDICSDECLRKEFEEYMKFNSNTKEIEIEKKNYNGLLS